MSTPPVGERGSGLLSTTIGVSTVIAMLGFAANVSLGLWTRSTVDSIAYDAARQVATAPALSPAGRGSTPAVDAQNDARNEAAAIEDARRLLGRFGQDVQFDFEQAPGSEQVVLHVTAPGNSLLPRMIGGGAVVGALDRRIVLRREGT